MNWQPIETAPKDCEALFWVVARTATEAAFANTNGEPIVSHHAPYILQGKFGRWSCLSKATHWMPLPEPPA